MTSARSLLARSAQIAALIASLSLVTARAAPAQGAGVLGSWVIAKAVLAPWADPKQAGGPAEEKRLVGRTVTFAAHSVRGPAPLGCGHAVYAAHDDTADLLFEGGLAEDAGGRPLDAVALARGLGMTTRTVHTIETGCSEVAYHRLAPDTLVFGLNNRIYTLHPSRKP
ncbi:MAG TPA: hypothetical protein VHZ26_01850 [Caulobacteraceae bacterium]|jgi:hypothetical protein|nr:hypothetical protein [Caulobacteraceae bacterium]